MTPEDTLSTRLQDDIVWRVRELSEIVRLCKDAGGTQKIAALRASVPVLYAHWEGYFVVATNAYLNFVTEKRCTLSSLRAEFWALTVRKRVRPNQINGDISFSRFLLEVRGEADRTFKKGTFERINGASNLKSDVVKFCCECIGLDWRHYERYFDFIDKELIDKRNHIAHGSSVRFDENSVGEFRDKVVELMRITQVEIENSAVCGKFLKTTVS